VAGTPASSVGSGDGLFAGYALLRDEKAANTNGGTFTLGARRTRDLNVEKFDFGGIVTLAGNQFTLAAGTYYVDGRAPAVSVSIHKAFIVNVTDAVDVVIGSNTLSGDTSQSTDSIVRGRFTIAATKVFELQHQSLGTRATDGFGVAANIGVVEVYSEVLIFLEA